jgi:hypothetical protein
MKPMRVKTVTGSVYDISFSGVCIKYDLYGRRVDAFKPFIMKPVPDHVVNLEEIHSLPQGDPVVGQRLYLSGLKSWWVTTEVVSVRRKVFGRVVDLFARKLTFGYYKILFTVDRWKRFRKGSAEK